MIKLLGFWFEVQSFLDVNRFLLTTSSLKVNSANHSWITTISVFRRLTVVTLLRMKFIASQIFLRNTNTKWRKYMSKLNRFQCRDPLSQKQQHSGGICRLKQKLKKHIFFSGLWLQFWHNQVSIVQSIHDLHYLKPDPESIGYTVTLRLLFSSGVAFSWA